jgi:cytochrome c553
MQARHPQAHQTYWPTHDGRRHRGKVVAGLTDENLRDLAAYYAYLPSETPEHPERLTQAPPIVATGAPMRNIDRGE